VQVIKGLLSAAALQDEVQGIPSYSSVLAVELLSDGTDWAVRFMFQNGPQDDYTVSTVLSVSQSSYRRLSACL
jgi:hypothetical protein